MIPKLTLLEKIEKPKDDEEVITHFEVFGVRVIGKKRIFFEVPTNREYPVENYEDFFSCVDEEFQYIGYNKGSFIVQWYKMIRNKTKKHLEFKYKIFPLHKKEEEKLSTK